MADWDKSFAKLMRWECHPGPLKPVGDGIVDNPKDYGGATVYGISTKELAKHGTKPEELGITDYLPHSLAQVTLERAKAWFRKNYWDVQPYQQIQDDDVATKILLLSVNNNAHNSWTFAQKAANGLGASLVEDGCPGPKTIAAINACPAGELLKALIAAQVAFYRVIVARDPSQSIFLAGWLARARDV